MADVRAFRGLRFTPDRAPDLGRALCPPYDVMSADDERRFRELAPYNAVRLELAVSPADPTDDRYDGAARTLREWRADGTLMLEDEPTLYLHEASFPHGGQTRTRRELIAAVGLEPWDRHVVLPHERTYDRPKADRLRLLEATRTQISPILSFFRPGDEDALGAAWAWAEGRPPAAEGTDAEGVGHRLWTLREPELVKRVERAFADRQLFIADGHHRYETALHYRERLRAAGPLAADHPANSVMMHLIAEDDPGLVVLPIHRLLRGLDGLDAVELEEVLSAEFHAEYFPLWPDGPPEQIDAYVTQLASTGRADRALGVYGPDPEIFAILSLRDRQAQPASIPEGRDPSWQGLDVVLADQAVIRPLLARQGLAAEDAIDYTRDPHEAFRAVRSGERQLAVLLNPTRVEQIAAVALADERMPEKSTYFFPKAPTGLVFRPLA
jgi:uncharacterized protein (DUF1015 family)